MNFYAVYDPVASEHDPESDTLLCVVRAATPAKAAAAAFRRNAGASFRLTSLRVRRMRLRGSCCVLAPYGQVHYFERPKPARRTSSNTGRR